MGITYNQYARTSCVMCEGVLYIILWPWPELGANDVCTSVWYCNEDNVWHKH